MATRRAIRARLAALALVALAQPAYGETAALPDGFYAESEAFVLSHMRELAAAVMKLAPDAANVGDGREYRFAGLRALDTHFPGGMPIAGDGRVTARLARLSYRDRPPAGLSRGDELEFEIETTANGARCTTRYWFYWEREGPLGLGSPGTECAPPATMPSAEPDAATLLERFGSDKDLLQFLLQKEMEMAEPRPSRGRSQRP
jgi:hypothetical protein